jgi:glutamate--cysteine ligase
LAREGLRRQGARDAEGNDETRYLEPLEELAAQGRCPADAVLETWRSGGLPALVERFRYRAGASLYSAAR